MINRILNSLNSRIQYFTFYKCDKDGNLVVGFNASKKFAKFYNSLKRFKTVQNRNQLYKHQYEQLLKENGPVTETIKIRDGYGIDETRRLPYLNEVVDTCKKLIKIKEEQGIVSKGKKNLIGLYNHKDLKQYPEFFNFATSSSIISVLSDYFGYLPVLSGFDIFISQHVDDFYSNGSAYFHLDRLDTKGARVVIHLNDINENDGPFCLLPASVSETAGKKLGYGKRKQVSKDLVEDEAMYKTIAKDNLIVGTFKEGTVLYCDTGNCFHYGSRTNKGKRYVIMFTYNSVAAQNFYGNMDGFNLADLAGYKYSTLQKLVLSDSYIA